MKWPVLVVFDLDGTLVDSRADLANAANAALSKLGLPPLSRETIVSYVGDGIDALLRRCLTERHQGLLDEARRHFHTYYSEHLLDRTVLLPGVRETLERLHERSKLTVLTNKTEAYAVKILEGFGIASYFAEIVGESDGRVPKPNSGLLVGIMERLRAPRDRTLMVGDGKNDILVAKRAGCLSCGVADSEDKERTLAAYKPDYIIRSVRELPKLFEEGREERA